MYLKSVDLDNFPTNKIAQRMLSRVSPIYDRSYVMKWIYQIMGTELEAMSRYVKMFPLQRFPETATWGMSYLEQKYGIPVDESLDLKERRDRVLLCRPYRGAANPYYIEQVVKKACGADVTTEEHNDEYYFDVYFEEHLDADGLGKMLDALNSAKPSHLGTNCRVKAPTVNSEHIFASGIYVYRHTCFEQFIPREKHVTTHMRLYVGADYRASARVIIAQEIQNNRKVSIEGRVFHIANLSSMHGQIKISQITRRTYMNLKKSTYGAIKGMSYAHVLQSKEE